jgi:hypothetical protein
MKDSTSTYPRLQEHLRTTCDLATTSLFFDDCSDVAHKDNVQVMTSIIMDTLRNSHTPRPKDEWVGGEVVRQ